MHRIIFAVVIACSSGLAAYAQPVERLTAGDILLRDITEVFNAKNDLTRTVNQLNADFAATRKALAEAEPGTLAHTEAQQKLDQLELGKNISLLLPYIPYGVTTDTEMAMKIPQMLAGASLDGGILLEARQKYLSWVRAVRSSLGKRDGELLVLSDSPEHVDRFMKALVENQGVYAEYVKAAGEARVNEAARRQQQNQAQLDRREEGKRRAELAKLPDGGIALSHSKTVPVMDRGAHFLRSPNGQLGALLKKESGRGQQILYCSYGPIPSTGTMSGIDFKTNYFWYKTVPADLDKFIEIDSSGTLMDLPKQPFSECPTSQDAETLRLAAYYAHPNFCKSLAQEIQNLDARRLPKLPPNQKDPFEQQRRQYAKYCS